MKKRLLEKIWQKAKLATWILKNIPFIRMIAVNGSLATQKINKNSDIDFFIICYKTRLWTARFFTQLILDIFGLRAKGKKYAQKICLNHFLSSQNYQLTPKNKYNAIEYSQLIILYQEDCTHSKFLKNNLWIFKYVKEIKNIYSQNLPSFFKIFFEKILISKIGDKLESKLKKMQLARIKSNPFFNHPDSVMKKTDQEFYYYTDARKKWKTRR